MPTVYFIEEKHLDLKNTQSYVYCIDEPIQRNTLMPFLTDLLYL